MKNFRPATKKKTLDTDNTEVTSITDFMDDVVCINPQTGVEMNHHSILVGKKCAYCMECGQILIEYKDKEDFKKLMNPIDE